MRFASTTPHFELADPCLDERFRARPGGGGLLDLCRCRCRHGGHQERGQTDF
jgi:hypothetical protein